MSHQNQVTANNLFSHQIAIESKQGGHLKLNCCLGEKCYPSTTINMSLLHNLDLARKTPKTSLTVVLDTYSSCHSEIDISRIIFISSFIQTVNYSWYKNNAYFVLLKMLKWSNKKTWITTKLVNSTEMTGLICNCLSTNVSLNRDQWSKETVIRFVF